MELSTLIRYCKIYDKLGQSVQEQLDDIMSEGSFDDQNPNALRHILDFLETLDIDSVEASDLYEELAQYLD